MSLQQGDSDSLWYSDDKILRGDNVLTIDHYKNARKE